MALYIPGGAGILPSTVVRVYHHPRLTSIFWNRGNDASKATEPPSSSKQSHGCVPKYRHSNLDMKQDIYHMYKIIYVYAQVVYISYMHIIQRTH